MKKFEITEEQIKQAHGAACAYWKKTIENWFPEWNKKQSGWYKFDEYPKYLIYIDYENNKVYGFNITGKWFEDVHADHYDYYDPVVNEKEVEERLIEEAKRRGYKKGVVVDNSNLPIVNFPQDGKPLYSSDMNFYDNLLQIGQKFIFSRGQWAEIISTPEPDEYITVNNIKYKRCN